MNEPRSVSGVLRWIVSDPWNAVCRRWNYKSAVVSALMRAGIFLGANLSAGPEAALSAMGVEFVFRFATAGFYGAVTQAFRGVEPARTGALAAGILLPLVAHSLELVVHWLHGTPNLAASIGASLALTMVSTSFNLFAMRRGALIVGEGCRSLRSDLASMPQLIAAFVLALTRGCLRLAP